MSIAQWTPSARADLARIDDYYAAVAPAFANRVGRLAIAAGRFLSEHPYAGAVFEEPVRKWRVPATDYILFYRPVAGGVEIVRLRHARQDWSTAS